MIPVVCLIPMVVSWGSALDVSFHPNTTPEYLVDRVRDFTGILGEELFLLSSARNSNVVFSGLRVFTSLVRAQHGATRLTKREIGDALLVDPSLQLCDLVTNLTSLGPCHDHRDFNMVHRHYLFFDRSLDPNHPMLRHSCFQDEYKPIPFGNQSTAWAAVNDWYRRLPSKQDRRYLDHPLQADSKVIFLSGFRQSNLSMLGYVTASTVMFENIDQETVTLPGMKKTGQFYTTGPYQGFTIYREDLPGDRYSLLFLQVNMVPMELRQNFVLSFKPQVLKQLLQTAMEITTVTNMTLILPAVSLDSRLDLRPVLEDMCIHSLFEQRNALRRLFSTDFYVNEFPHSETLDFFPSAPRKGQTDLPRPKTISTPFWVLIVNKHNRVPLLSGLHLGFPSNIGSL